MCLQLNGGTIMRVCFFGYIGVNKKEGASLSLLNVMSELKRRGHEVFFVTAIDDLIPQLKKMNIRCVKLLTYTMRQENNETGVYGLIKYRIKDIINNIAIVRGAKLLQNYQFDVIHINGIDNHVGAAIATKLGIPYFWHIRQFLQEDLGKRLVGEKIILKYLRQANGVIGISNAVRRKFEKILNRPVRVIYNGIPLQNYEIGVVERFKSENVRMLLAGRITENKGQLEAVEALNILQRKGIHNLKLALVGNAEPDYLDKIKKVITDNVLEDCVSVFDYCDDLNELRKNFDIGLVCSKNEAFGRVTIEYMCAEMLVLGANTGGTVELIQDGKTGLLYEQGNPSDLAAKIKYAISHPSDMRKIAKDSKNYAFSKFSIERVCDEIIDLYENPDFFTDK